MITHYDLSLAMRDGIAITICDVDTGAWLSGTISNVFKAAYGHAYVAMRQEDRTCILVHVEVWEYV